MGYPAFVSGDVLNASDMNAVGLWRVTGCTVTSAGGTAATASNGVITVGSGNTSVTVSNAFSSDYNNYKIMFNGGVGSTTQVINLALGASTTGYYGNLIAAAYNSATVNGNQINNAASWLYAGVSTTASNFMNVDLMSPNLAKVTSINGSYIGTDTTGVGGTLVGFHNVATAYTAFTISVGGTMTGGTIRVYGYRN